MSPNAKGNQKWGFASLDRGPGQPTMVVQHIGKGVFSEQLAKPKQQTLVK